MMSRSLIVVLGIVGLWTLMVGVGLAQERNEGWLIRESIEVTRVKAGLRIACQLKTPQGSERTGELKFTLVDLDDKTLLEEKSLLDLASLDQKVSVVLRGNVEDEKVPLCVLRYRLKMGKHVEEGSRSLMASLAQLETRIVAYRDLLAGTKASLRVVALNHATGRPVNDARVTISLIEKENARKLFEGKTRKNGSAMAQFDVPSDVEGTCQLKVTVEHERLGKDEVLQSVSVQRKAKILLTTDKPLYQPGQLIHMRTLCLAAGTLAPQAGKPLTFEVMDSKGNKVFKKKTETDDFGIASAEFQLATELNLGTYIVRAILDSSQTEKNVDVQRYVLPKFKVQVKTDRDFYLPGETLKGEVQADYLFGKPVSGGKVTVVASKFEIQFE
ncbi:MAG TPA: MG2 domain-containing protein [bacterium]|nr:MG2 domain-containing protein [bacterium]